MEMECWQAAVCEDNLGALGLIREQLEGAFHDQKLPIVLDGVYDYDFAKRCPRCR